MLKRVVCCDKCEKELTEEEKSNIYYDDYFMDSPVFCNNCFKKIKPIVEEIRHTQEKLNKLNTELREKIKKEVDKNVDKKSR